MVKLGFALLFSLPVGFGRVNRAPRFSRRSSSTKFRRLYDIEDKEYASRAFVLLQ